MSRIGKRPISVPQGVDVKIDGSKVSVKGPKGQLSRELRSEIDIKMEDGHILVSPKNDNKTSRSLYGLSRTLIANMVEGVTQGFTKNLEMIGVGYKAQLKGRNLVLNVGYSHPVEIEAPEGIELATEGPTKLLVSGIDKELVGNIAAKIRAVRKPEPYKGKGIRYQGEVVRRKAGKTK
jgi:large subunit ribosomal protein L6